MFLEKSRQRYPMMAHRTLTSSRDVTRRSQLKSTPRSVRPDLFTRGRQARKVDVCTCAIPNGESLSYKLERPQRPGKSTHIDKNKESLKSTFSLTESAVCPKRIQHKIGAVKTADACLDIVDVYAKFLDDVHVSSLYNKVADFCLSKQIDKEALTSDERFKALGRLVKRRLHSMDSRSLSTVSNACGKLQHCDCDIILSFIREKVNGNIGQFSVRDLENIVWAHAKLKLWLPSAELDMWFLHISHKLRNRDSKYASKLLYSCQKLHYKPTESTLAVLLQPIEDNMAELSPVDLIHVLCSLAHFRYPSSLPTVELITRRIENKLEIEMGKHRKVKCNMLNISNMLWSYSKMNFHPGSKLLALTDSLVSTFTTAKVKPYEISTYLRACSKLSWCPADDILASLLPLMEASLDSSEVKDTVGLLKSMAMLNVRPPERALNKLQDQLLHSIKLSESKLLEDSLWVFAKMHYPINEMLEEQTLQILERQCSNIRASSLCRMTWSLAILNTNLDDLLLDHIVQTWDNECATSCHSAGLLLWSCKMNNFEVDPEIHLRISNHLKYNNHAMTSGEVLFAIDSLPKYLIERDEPWFFEAIQSIEGDPFLTDNERGILESLVQEYGLQSTLSTITSEAIVSAGESAVAEE